MNSKSKKIIIVISILSSLYFLKELLYFAAFPRTERLPIGKEAVWLSNSLNQTQMSYFLENQNFTTVVNDLSEENLLNYSETHKYSIEVIENSAFNHSIINTARGDLFFRKHSPVLSRVFGWGNSPTYTVAGAVFYIRSEEELKDIVCMSNSPGWQQLDKPYLKNNEPFCGADTTQYR